MLIEKFASKSPTCVQFDEKLQFYSNLVLEVRTVLLVYVDGGTTYYFYSFVVCIEHYRHYSTTFLENLL